MAGSSRLPGFYKRPLPQRLDLLAEQLDLSSDEIAVLNGTAGLTPRIADKLVENAVGIYGLPLAIAANFIVNGHEVLVPMVIEEPSVVAAASNMARLARQTGGFTAESTEPKMIGQVQVMDLDDLNAAAQAINDAADDLLTLVREQNPRIVARGGGPRAIETHLFPHSPAGPMLVIHLIMDTRDAMGANMINGACEALAAPIEALTGGRVNLRILSNLSDQRMTRAEVRVPVNAFTRDDMPGALVAERIIEAWAFAVIDPYRAATHNKGVMNGIDPVVLATGNDWRAVEAGAHAYAARNGHYTSLTTWKIEGDMLHGTIEVPLALGIVGGTTRAHPVAGLALKILGVETAADLANITASVGLAQNLGALRALAAEGIQQGHMALHARQIALAAGATDAQIEQVVARMLETRQITLTFAQDYLANFKQAL